MRNFFHMGGYAFYVWSAYSLALIILTLNLITPISHRRRILQNFQRRLHNEQNNYDR